MRRASVLAAVLAAGAAACGNSSKPVATGQLKQPSSVAAFAGYTSANDGQLQAYVAIANTGRNDLTLVKAVDDGIVKAPVQFRPLAVPVDAPALLAATSLGDQAADGARLPDLLVVAAAGDSRLQLVRTWTADTAVVTAQEVVLPGDVLAVAAIPSPPGTARLAVALSGRQLAVVHYRRVPGGVAVETAPLAANGPPFVVQPLGFEIASLATARGDPAHVYAASLEPIATGPVLGVAEIDVSAASGPWTVRALGARGATRLVAAASLRAEAPSGATATDATAFDGQPPVTRVYAVLDEGSCGADRPIDCGVVALDPALDTATRGHSIPDDWTPPGGEPWMPYRAPIRFATRPLAIAVSPPPVLPPSDAAEDAVYHGDFMRLFANGAWATTGVGAVATADGALRFLDLGRFKEASATAVPVAATAGAVLPTTDARLWFQQIGAPAGQFVDSTAAAGAAVIRTTPGWTPPETWTLNYQGSLSGLFQRTAEAGADASGTWLALQVGGPGAVGPGRRVTDVARLFHPSLGVQVGDIVVFLASTVGGECVGTTPPGTSPVNEASTPKQFEVRIAGLLPPDAGRPGGFVVIDERTPLEAEPADDPADTSSQWAKWRTCLAALRGRIAAEPDGVVTGLVASIHAQGLLLAGNILGYAGRPAFHEPYTLQYRASSADPDEDALAAACPLADWDGTLPPPACGGGTCDRTVCERLVLARKARRVLRVAETCGTDQPCIDRMAAAGITLPITNGPAVAFQVDRQVVRGTTTDRVRGLTLSFSTQSGSFGETAGGATVALPGGVIPFDRSPWGDPAGGYRFWAAYPAGLVVDASPSVTPVAAAAIR